MDKKTLTDTSIADVEIVLVIERELQRGFQIALQGLLLRGEDIGARHIMAAISTFFTATLAVTLPPEAWSGVFAALADAHPEMQSYRNDYLRERGRAPDPEPAVDPAAN